MRNRRTVLDTFAAKKQTRLKLFMQIIYCIRMLYDALLKKTNLIYEFLLKNDGDIGIYAKICVFLRVFSCNLPKMLPKNEYPSDLNI